MTHSTESLDPHVRAMRDAEDDAERANVLLTAPVFTLMRWRATFVTYCRRAAFRDGEHYLNMLADTLSKERHRGNLGGTMPMSGATATLLGILEKAAR
ncbi:hypothetical protein LB572_01110 [Mesorhizobium sp. BH1-1-5]|uniref:hypothetical protein n=1 Tax=Mesorhizobium sp. BH1-1-5 TaxID=2876661 RepID=UPI001CCE9222|nr:hypothetical protein [Mesorhizobium sp. BH1-1-5]MBZ9985688.1 hypothetical protein [Mesorhizobium sp. BH1-1-5]